jgi:hypothetical protein
MSKTFKDEKYHNYPKLHRQLRLSGKHVDTWIHPTGGNHSYEKCRRGAKRYLRRAERHYENLALKEMTYGKDAISQREWEDTLEGVM